jgi:carbon storage regulator
MLVLSRRKDECIVIGEEGPDQIIVMVVEIRGDKVRLGIKAGNHIPVHRLEVYEAIKKQVDDHNRSQGF